MLKTLWSVFERVFVVVRTVFGTHGSLRLPRPDPTHAQFQADYSKNLATYYTRTPKQELAAMKEDVRDEVKRQQELADL